MKTASVAPRPVRLGVVMIVATLGLAFASGCGVQRIARPAYPPATLPELAQEPPPERDGVTRVVVGTDVRARVLRVVGDGRTTGSGRAKYLQTTKLCDETPCVFELPRGEHKIRIEGIDDVDRTSIVVVAANRPTVVINHVLGRNTRSVLAPIGMGILTAGILTLVTSLAIADATPPGEGQSAMPALGVAALGGLGAIVVGGGLYLAAPTIARQEGATRQWSPPAGPVAGAGVGVRF